MVSKEQRKKQIKILRKFRKMINNGSGRMEAYEKLAKQFEMSVSGIRHSILAAMTKDIPRKIGTEDDLPW